MRLIKLKIKNIASLKGEHLIDFGFIQNQSPLFAITGETGAGKSSILNSIGLALYGKVYKSNVTQNDLVTLGEKEGQIELIFQSKGKSYYAFWKARVRKQNGEFYSTPQTPQRELYTLEGNEFDSPKTILTTRVEELLNLDFDQFCKCIILNQGEFARFLSSSFTERKEILEKLYPGELLDSLSVQLKKEKDELEKQIAEIDIELHTLKGDGPQGDDLKILKDKLETEYKLHESWLTTLESIDYHYVSLSSHQVKFLESKSKIESIKQNLTKDTAQFNEYLANSQLAAEELLKVQKEQEVALPGLQELLKSEETLRNSLDLLNTVTNNLKQLETQQSDFKAKSEINAQKITKWEDDSIALIQSFQLPLTELKEEAKNIEPILELFTKKLLLEQELKSKEERLTQLELQGKEEAQALKDLTAKKANFGDDKQKLTDLEGQQKEIKKSTEEKQMLQLKINEIKSKISELEKLYVDLHNKTKANQEELTALEAEYLPLQTTIKLQSLLSAVEVCVTHPSLEESKACPVCHTNLKGEQIKSLKENLEKTDFTRVKLREAELSRLIIKRESELHQGIEKTKQTQIELHQKEQELKELEVKKNQEIPSIDSIESQLKDIQKRVWEQEKILQEEERMSSILARTREQYLSLKNETIAKSKIKDELLQKLTILTTPLSFLKELTQETIDLLKAENRKLLQHLELESNGDKLKQEKDFLGQNLNQVTSELKKLQTQFAELTQKTTQIKETLAKELKGKKASELISELNSTVKEKADILATKERELKAQELKLKESQSRLYTLEEHIKDIDLHFTKELHALREFAKTALPRISQELTTLMDKLSTLALELTSPEALFVPLKDLIESQKKFYKEKTSELKMNFASVRARLEDWEKRQDRITLLHLKSKDLADALARRSRLYEVLGKDELRTFVLSMVEENLITQTNDELQKLCQGRYEIVHQSRKMKLTPEFYILDKFREGGLRKVSTLSGGETFMVSLAMALGLAEMTRGKAEIDTLFIDEGFGTLDQESLEDVLDMLKQIQTRGLMVGIISHVKALTQSLPVNLLVSKKQDGTSSVSVVYN